MFNKKQINELKNEIEELKTKHEDLKSELKNLQHNVFKLEKGLFKNKYPSGFLYMPINTEWRSNRCQYVCFYKYISWNEIETLELFCSNFSCCILEYKIIKNELNTYIGIKYSENSREGIIYYLITKNNEVIHIENNNIFNETEWITYVKDENYEMFLS